MNAKAKHSQELRPGTRLLDRYVIEKRFDTGGHSLVYRAHDERLARPVCVKVFQTAQHGNDPVYRTSYEHFVQEAFALSKLTHPNTLRIFDFGHLPGDPAGPPFQVSELLAGGTLSARVRTRGPMSPEEAVAMAVSLCGALTEAHQHGIIHRDIKPKNILFGQSGSHEIVKLVDFSIAKTTAKIANQAGDTEVVAGAPMLMYSPFWAPPEQLSVRDITLVSDLYALSAVVVFALCGRPIFRSKHALEARGERERATELIEEALAATQASRSLIRVLRRACSFSRKRRPQSAGEFAADLRAAMTVNEDEIVTPIRPPKPSFVKIQPQAGTVRFGDRVASFIGAAGGAVDIECPGTSAKIRGSLVANGRGGHVLHIRGLNCFVRAVDGRPTNAVSLRESGALELLTPRGEVQSLFSVSFSAAGAFAIGEQTVTVETAIGQEAIALDFGDAKRCLFLYPGTPMSAPAGKHRKERP